MSDASAPFSRVDKILQERFPSLTGRQVDEAIAAGWVLKDSRPVAKGDRVPSSSLDVSLLEKSIQVIKQGNPNLKLDVVWEDQGAWIVDKIAGMPSHSLSLFDKHTVTQWALAQNPELGKSFQAIQPTVTPHRLDTGTSGLLVVCKSAEAYEKWRLRFKEKQVQKKYLAWCFGEEKEKEFQINCPIGHNPSDARKMVAVPTGGEKYRAPLLEAVTHVKWVKTEKGLSLWEIQCQTGVTHQVRVHLSLVGHPLVGDPLYDSLYEERPIKPTYHQLRATELKWEAHTVQLPAPQAFHSSETFRV